MSEYLLKKRKAINQWDKGASEVVSDTRAEGSPWIAADSILRPNNMSLWLDLKQAEPEFSLGSPASYENVMRQHRERMKAAEDDFKKRGR